MSEVVDSFSGAFFPRGVPYGNPESSHAFWFYGVNDRLFPPCKRPRFSVVPPSIRRGTTLEDLPDECLFEIFRRVSGGRERSACACVSKRWLMILSTIRSSEFNLTELGVSQVVDAGFLRRYLKGEQVSDLRLTAMAVALSSRGGLRRLSIEDAHPTDSSLAAIARSSPSLESLRVSSITDEGLIEFAKGCPNLEDLALYHSLVTDKALIEIAVNCKKLKHLILYECPNVGNQGLLSVGKYCLNLSGIEVKHCPGINDQGVAGLVSLASYTLQKLRIQNQNVTDVCLAVIGHYGKALTELSLSNLDKVTERGFWVMGNCHGLQKLYYLEIVSCSGMTDLGIEAIAKGCPNLESISIECCNQVTEFGIYNVIKSTNLCTLHLNGCAGVKDRLGVVEEESCCGSLSTLLIFNCPGVGDSFLKQLRRFCSNIAELVFCSLPGITDSGCVDLIRAVKKRSLRNVSFASCVNVSDKAVSRVCKNHGRALEQLDLSGCLQVSDHSLEAVVDHCPYLIDLDVSGCGVTDSGIEALASAESLSLQTLSVSGCGLITDKSFVFFRAMGEFLLDLDLQNCRGISKKKIRVLAKQLGRCTILPKA